jgi:hypothetical protein
VRVTLPVKEERTKWITSSTLKLSPMTYVKYNISMQISFPASRLIPGKNP